MALTFFGMTLTEAPKKKICIDCNRPKWLMKHLTQKDIKE